jgi:hypothetical protein
MCVCVGGGGGMREGGGLCVGMSCVGRVLTTSLKESGTGGSAVLATSLLCFLSIKMTAILADLVSAVSSSGVGHLTPGEWEAPA